MIGFVNNFVYNLSSSQSIIVLSLIYQLHKSLGHYPFPGNGFITGTVTSNHHEVLAFLDHSPWNADPLELDPVLQF
jgi:hypothetical protein